MDPNNTNNNKTDISETNSNLIVSITHNRSDDRCDSDEEILRYQSAIKQNIDYDSLLRVYPTEKETIDGICQLILETMLLSGDKILIARNWYPASLVKSKFMKLNYSHIEYVMNRLHSNTGKVRNIKKYILAALFNAPNTMDIYYRAEVNHDMSQFIV